MWKVQLQTRRHTYTSNNTVFRTHASPGTYGTFEIKSGVTPDLYVKG